MILLSSGLPKENYISELCLIFPVFLVQQFQQALNMSLSLQTFWSRLR